MLYFYANVRTIKFLWTQYFDKRCILIKDVFVSQLSCNVGISVCWIVWVTINCHFMSNISVLIFITVTYFVADCCVPLLTAPMFSTFNSVYPVFSRCFLFSHSLNVLVHYLYQYFRIWYLGYVPFISLFLCSFGMWPHSLYLLHTVHCFCSRNCVSSFMFVSAVDLMPSCVSCHPHWFVSCFTVCLLCLLPTWCPVFKQTPCVYAFCSVIHFRGSYKTMDHSKVSPSCGNKTHIWQSLWTTLY